MDGSHARVLLGLPEHATTGQIRRAFRGAALVAHPDRGGNAGSFSLLLDARDTLLATASSSPAPSGSGSPSVTSRRHRYLDLTRAAGRSTMSVVDIERPAPTPGARAAAPSDFDSVLAEVLADDRPTGVVDLGGRPADLAACSRR